MLTEILISSCLVIGGVFGLVGSVGLIKLQDTMQRLHAPTKASTVGVGGVLIASMLYFTFVKDSFSFHEMLIALFLFLTAPISALFLAQTHIITKMSRDDIPDTGRKHDWSIYDDPPLSEPRGSETQ